MEAFDKLGINIPGLVAQLINFTILLIILYLFAYKPIIRMLDERSRRIKESMDKADEIREAAERAQEDMKARIEEARREGQTIVAQASQVGERLREEARQEARRETETLLVRARGEIQLEREEAMAELRREFVDLALLAAEKVIKESLDKERHRRLIDEVLEESSALGKR